MWYRADMYFSMALSSTTNDNDNDTISHYICIFLYLLFKITHKIN